MNKPSTQTIFKIVLAGAGIAHFIIGLIAVIPGIPKTTLAEIFYKASIVANPQMDHIVQMFGAYMLTIGILAFFAIKDPIKNAAIINGVIILLGIRVAQRVLFAGEAWDIFRIPAGWYWTQTIFFAAIAIALFYLKPKVEAA